MADRTNDPMDPSTLEALRGSIAKWEGIVAGTLPDLGVSNCALCQMFVLTHDNYDGCPVEAKTGHSDCVKTPYMAWARCNPWSDEPPHERWATTDKHRKLAQAELDFLKSLLPEAHVPALEQVAK